MGGLQQWSPMGENAVLKAMTEPARLRPIIAVIALATVGSGIIAWRFILPIPALFSVVLAIPLVLAYVTARSEQRIASSASRDDLRQPSA